MTKVQISETYAVGCPDCAQTLHRLVEWSARDPQVTGLAFKVVPRCEHALPLKDAAKLPAIVTAPRPTSTGTGSVAQTVPHPPGGSTLFAIGEMSPERLAGTGYDEPSAAS